MNQSFCLPVRDHYKKLACQHMKCELEKGLYRGDMDEFLGAAFQPEREWFLHHASRKEFAWLWARAYRCVQQFYQDRLKRAKAEGDDDMEVDCHLTLGNAANYFRDFRPMIESFRKEDIDPMYYKISIFN